MKTPILVAILLVSSLAFGTTPKQDSQKTPVKPALPTEHTRTHMNGLIISTNTGDQLLVCDTVESNSDELIQVKNCQLVTGHTLDELIDLLVKSSIIDKK